MKQLLAVLLVCALLFCLAACGNGAASADATDPSAETAQAPEKEAFDPYATENRYDVEKEMSAVQEGVDYGTVCDLTYPSTVAGDDKRCCVLLPAGYDESRTYPVLYVAHTFGGSPDELIAEGSYLTVLYGNMLADGLAVPMIIVAFDLYTDPAPASGAFPMSQFFTWPKYWSFSFNISPSSEHPGPISCRMDWLDLLAVQGILKSLLQHHSSKTSIFFNLNLFILIGG